MYNATFDNVQCMHILAWTFHFYYVFLLHATLIYVDGDADLGFSNM